jgi:hypothetical protein
MTNMRKLFHDILSTKGVKGILLFSFSGDLIFKELTSPVYKDLVFEKGRIYIRKTEIGYLVILMALFVPIAMIRLNCDILLPMLKQLKSGRKLGRFFKKK